jgi:glycosyltransferase involved in cell wall biosynthesis
MSSGLTIVLPTYNSGDLGEGRLPELVETFAAHFDPVEVIVVDDASDADFQDFVRQCTEAVPGVRVLRNRRNLGKGASVLLGIHRASQPKVVFTDADIPYDLESYARIAERLAAGAQVVIGCRRRHDSHILSRFDALGYAFSRHVVGVVFNRMVRGVTGLDFSDTQCGMKGFDREVALSLFAHVHSPRFLFDVELLLAATFQGVDVEEVPVCVIYEDSRSSVRVGYESWRMGRDLLRVWRSVRSGVYRESPRQALLDGIHTLTNEVTVAPAVETG